MKFTPPPLPYGVGIGLSAKMDLQGWARVRQTNRQLALEEQRERRLEEQMDYERRKAEFEWLAETQKGSGEILSPRLEAEYHKSYYDPITTKMGELYTKNPGIRDRTDYKSYTEYMKLSDQLTNNPVLADALYLQKQKDAYENYKLKYKTDETTRKFEEDLAAFESGTIDEVPTFMEYKFDPIAAVNSVKDNIDIVYDPKKAKWLGDYALVEGKFDPTALQNAAQLLYDRDKEGWFNYLTGDPYLQTDPVKAVANRIEQMVALEDKWLAAGTSGSGSGTPKTPVRNMLLDYVMHYDYYNNRKGQASKVSLLAPQTEIESYDGQVEPHLAISPEENVFAVEIPEGAPVNGGTVQGLEIPAGLNAVIRGGNGLRFYDGSEAGISGVNDPSLPTNQNIYTSIRVEIYDPNFDVATQAGDKTIGAPSPELQQVIQNLTDLGLTPTIKKHTVGTNTIFTGTAGEKQVSTVTVDLVVPVDWSRSSDFNEAFMTKDQVGKVNQEIGMVTQENFDMPVVGIMTDVGVDYDKAQEFLTKIAADNGYGTDLGKAEQFLRKTAAENKVSLQSLYLKLMK